jgi:hypothetical protein
MSRAVSALVVAVLVAAAPSSCTCQRAENVAAKERLSQPPPPDPTEKLAAEKIDPGALSTPEVMKRVSRMDAAEMQKRLGSFVYESKGDLSFLRSDAKVRSAETTRIVQSSSGDFAISVKTGDSSTQDLAFVNGVLFLKNNNGAWRLSRDPTGERNEHRRDSAGVWRSFYDLFGHALTVAPAGTGTHAGRPVVKYTMTLPDESALAKAEGATEPARVLGPDAGPVDATSLDEKKRIADRTSKWRKRAKPAGGGGEIWVDEATAVPLVVKFKGAMAVGDGPDPARLNVDLDVVVQDVGKDLQVQAPKDAVEDIVRKKYPVNPRAILEENGIVKPLPDAGPNKKKKKPAVEAAPPEEDAP